MKKIILITLLFSLLPFCSKAQTKEFDKTKNIAIENISLSGPHAKLVTPTKNALVNIIEETSGYDHGWDEYEKEKTEYVITISIPLTISVAWDETYDKEYTNKIVMFVELLDSHGKTIKTIYGDYNENYYGESFCSTEDETQADPTKNYFYFDLYSCSQETNVLGENSELWGQAKYENKKSAINIFNKIAAIRISDIRLTKNNIAPDIYEETNAKLNLIEHLLDSLNQIKEVKVTPGFCKATDLLAGLLSWKEFYIDGYVDIAKKSYLQDKHENNLASNCKYLMKKLYDKVAVEAIEGDAAAQFWQAHAIYYYGIGKSYSDDYYGRKGLELELYISAAMKGNIEAKQELISLIFSDRLIKSGLIDYSLYLKELLKANLLTQEKYNETTQYIRDNFILK